VPHDGRACGQHARRRQKLRPGHHGTTSQNSTEKEEIIQVLHFITKRIQVLLYFHANSNGLVAALQQYITNTKYPNLYSYSSHDSKNE